MVLRTPFIPDWGDQKVMQRGTDSRGKMLMSPLCLEKGWGKKKGGCIEGKCKANICQKCSGKCYLLSNCCKLVLHTKYFK